MFTVLEVKCGTRKSTTTVNFGELTVREINTISMITSRHTSRILFRTKRIATTKSFMGELAAKREMYKMKATYTGTGFT